MKPGFMRFFILVAVAAFALETADAATSLKYRVRKRLCEIGDTCPVEDSSLNPLGYTATINTDPVTGANQSLVSFTIAGAAAGDLFNWTLNDGNPGTPAISGNGSISGTTKTVSGINASSLSDGTLTLSVQLFRNDLWGNPVTDTAAKNTSGAGYASFSEGFDDETATAAGQPLTSNTITVSGFAGSLPVSVSGDASAQVSINGGACTASGSITSGQTLSLCAISPALDTSRIISVAVGSSTLSWKIGSRTPTSSIMAWGYNSYGQTGDGSTNNSNTPLAIPVLDGLSLVSVAPGTYSSCGLDSSGKAWCWGRNNSGQLGDGTNDNSLTPVEVSGAHSFRKLAAGMDHACGIDMAGVAWCWGSNGSGQLGNGTNTDSNVPVAVSGGIAFSDMNKFGYRHSCAIDTGQKAWCWGLSTYGTLGDGVPGSYSHSSNVPVAVLGNHNWIKVVGGMESTCGITTDGKARCWGIIGAAYAGYNYQPIEVTPGPGNYTDISSGFSHACAIAASDGSAWCWAACHDGACSSGEIGDGTGWGSPAPAAVLGGRSYAGIETGYTSTCAIENTTKDVWCWGNNSQGQLGDGTNTNSSVPVKVTGGYQFESMIVSASSTVFGFAGSGGGSSADTSAPTISMVLPQPGSTDAAENANLIMTFGENVVKGSGNIVIRKFSDGSAFETIPVTDAKVSIAGKIATINPAGTFASNTAYYVEVASGALEDSAGNAFAGITGSSTWAFTSESTDFAPPLVSTLSPADGEADVAIDANLSITFDEPVVKGSGNIVIRKTSDGTAIETIPVSDTRVSVSGSAATINPSGTFAGSTGYYVEVAANAFRDASANGFAGISGSGTWAFTSVAVDSSAPTVSALLPADNAASVSVDSNLTITFSENVVKGTGDIFIKRTSDGTEIETIPVTDARVSIAGAVATINPATTLTDNTGYYVEMAAGVFRDEGGNGFAGFSGSSTWNFTTGAATPATYMYCNEPDSSWQLLHNFSSGAFPSQRWNGAKHNAGSGNGVSIYNPAGYVKDYKVYAAMSGPGWGSAGWMKIVMPSGGNEFRLCYGNNHSSGTIKVAMNAYSNVVDSHSTYVTAKLYQGTYTPGDMVIIWEDWAQVLSMWMFIRNSNAPTIQSLSPADDATGTAVDSNLVLTFSKNVVKGSGNIVIRKTSDNSIVETIAVTDARVSVAGAVATINPAAILADTTAYYVEAATGTFVDGSGNAFAGLYGGTHWGFTTGVSGLLTSTCPNVGDICTGDSNTQYVGMQGGNKMFAKTADESSPYTWASQIDILTGANSLSDGMANTNLLLGGSFSATFPAADACRYYGPEWYLPSRDELADLFIAARDNASIADFGGGYYWSSSEYNDDSARTYIPATPTSGWTLKCCSGWKVRCVRRE